MHSCAEYWHFGGARSHRGTLKRGSSLISAARASQTQLKCARHSVPSCGLQALGTHVTPRLSLAGEVLSVIGGQTESWRGKTPPPASNPSHPLQPWLPQESREGCRARGMGLARPRAPPASTKASGALGPCPGSLAGPPTSCCDYSAVSRVELLKALQPHSAWGRGPQWRRTRWG